MLSLNRSTERPWVVLVEDDEALGGQLARALERALPELAIQCTSDADVALDLIRDSRSRLLITEAQTACVDGLALAACARRGRPELPLIFLADTQVAAASGRVPRLSGSHLISKPPKLDQFVDLVASVLEPAAGFHGELSTSGAFELVQLAAMVAPNGVLRLAGAAGSGEIWFEGGSVVHAALAGQRGTAAFTRMLGWRAGQFSIDPAACAPERSVTANTMALLLEAARVLDETRTLDQAADAYEREAPGSAHEPEARACDHDQGDARGSRDSGVVLRAVHGSDQAREPHTACATCATDHFESGLQAVWRKDYAGALPQWERALALDPDNRLYLHNLMRLRRLIDLDGAQRLGR